MGNQRKPSHLLLAASLTAFFGMNAFYGVAINPRFATIHTLDVIRLMTAGAAVAITLMLLSRFFVRSTRLEDNRAEKKNGEQCN